MHTLGEFVEYCLSKINKKIYTRSQNMCLPQMGEDVWGGITWIFGDIIHPSPIPIGTHSIIYKIVQTKMYERRRAKRGGKNFVFRRKHEILLNILFVNPN